MKKYKPPMFKSITDKTDKDQENFQQLACIKNICSKSTILK